ncbi:hypothetical protein [Cohnella kolymensis]|nr:hypothetical protein [Cohnella kolymensis]
MNDDTEGAAFKIFVACIGMCFIMLGVLGLRMLEIKQGQENFP